MKKKKKKIADKSEDKNVLLDLLRNWIEDDGNPDIPKKLIEKLRHQRENTMVVVRLVAMVMVSQLGRTTMLLERIGTILETRLQEPDLSSLSTTDLLDQKSKILQSALLSLKFLNNVQGTKEAMESPELNQWLEKAAWGPPNQNNYDMSQARNDLIPDTPAEREKMRIQYLIEKHQDNIKQNRPYWKDSDEN